MKLQQVHGKEYLYVCLSDRGVHKKLRVAAMVAEAFIGPRPAGLEIRHLNGDAQDNRAENLRYGTSSANKLDRLRHGTDRNASKTHCPQGHEYTPENTCMHGPQRRWRRCRTCARAQDRARRLARSVA